MKPMLAGEFKEELIKFPCYVQPKLDGIRMFVEDGIAYARSLKPIRAEWLQKIVKQHEHTLNGLDGEIICGSPTADDVFRRTTSSIMSYDKPDEFCFYVYDIQNTDNPYYERLCDLEFKNLPDFVKLVETKMVHSLADIRKHEEAYLAQGYEGAILRSHTGYYKQGRATARSGELIKLKRFVDTEAQIIGFHELMHNDNPQMTNELGYAERSSHKENLVPMNKLGALEVRFVKPDGKSIKLSLGTGFTDAQRIEMWENRQSLIGQYAKFKYFPGGVKDAPRFPVFLGIRISDDIAPLEAESSVEQLNLFGE